MLITRQVATGEENAADVRVYASEGAIKWHQRIANYLEAISLSRTAPDADPRPGHLSDAAKRYPHSHRPPRGLSEAFATIYVGRCAAIRAHIDGKPLKPAEFDFRTVHDGLRRYAVHQPRHRILAMPARAGSRCLKRKEIDFVSRWPGEESPRSSPRASWASRELTPGTTLKAAR